MPNLLLRHWPLKLAAVLIALGLWTFVASGGRAEMLLTVPVEYSGLGNDRVLVGPGVERVDVQLDVARWAAGRVSEATVRARVNLAGAGEGQRVVTLTPTDVQVPPGVKVTRITPSRLHLTLARAAEGTFRVQPQVRGAPAPGYTVAGVAVDPSLIQVRGPRSTIERRDTVETAPVDVTGQHRSVSQTVGLLLPEFVYPIRAGGVQVTVEIRKEPAQ